MLAIFFRCPLIPPGSTRGPPAKSNSNFQQPAHHTHTTANNGSYTCAGRRVQGEG
ncbi:unnamed protein product [Ectocarpus sp. 12 AP-2014]